MSPVATPSSPPPRAERPRQPRRRIPGRTEAVTRNPLPPVIRPATADEFGHLRRIELDADRLYESIGIGPFDDDDSNDHLADAVAVFSAGDPAVGFVSLELVDGAVHIDQLSVLPSHGRRGIGRSLVGTAVAWARASGHGAVTLTTFRDVPWNAPFYRSIGFRTITDLTPGLADLRAHERATGFDDHGPRVAMRLEL